MVLWYVGLSAVAVWAVFHDPRIDYRFLALGALLPDAVDALAAGERAYAHTLLAPVAALFLVVAVTAGRRPARPRLLMVPIGMFLHLALDGMWTHPDTFWWPLLGHGVRAGPFVTSVTAAVAREVVGLGAVAWFVRRFGLAAPEARRRLLRTGQVEVRP